MPANKVTIRGTARDAKGGAVVVKSDGSPIYIENLDSWPSDLRGKEVIVAGVLCTKKLIPDPYIAPDGGISQGAVGNQEVLEQAEWKQT